ncbi:MAG: hypothetical protein AAF744_03540 [Pseudomonadota bacterium]
MTDATISGVPLVGRAPKAATRQVVLPKPKPFGAPVLITDVVTPLAGETVFSLLWKQMERELSERVDKDPRNP